MAETAEFINRELSWLEFNQRVLEQALDGEIPLLERLRFLAISASNLDEFFMVRVGGLQVLAQSGSARTDPSGLTPARQLEAIHARLQTMVAEQYRCFLKLLGPALLAAGVVRVQPDGVDDRRLAFLERLCGDELLPVLTPMALAAADEKPLIQNLGLYTVVRFEDEAAPDRPDLVIIPLGGFRGRVVTLPADAGYAYMLLEDVVRLFIGRWFPGRVLAESGVFRLTRNADVDLREDMAEDLLREMQALLVERRQSDAVRLEVEAGLSKGLVRRLESVLEVPTGHTFAVPGPVHLGAFSALAGMDGFAELKYEPWPPQPAPEAPPRQSLFDILGHGNILLVHPYQEFDPVVRLLAEAAEDPSVLAIKQILYRTSRNSPLVAALSRAAQRGKYVTVIVELKARFDEARNIEWARRLEQDGVQVIYGIKGLKTHAKTCLIVRREPQGIARYLHFGTGNYNEVTARLYSDLSYLTADEELGRDTAAFFNAITGYSIPEPYRKLAAAPLGLRARLEELIASEAEHKRQGQEALIMAKMNSLEHPDIIRALYAASQAGVKILLNVRGICCLRPGVAGLSKNIRVVSIVDRFLEHARLLYFHRGGEEKVFLSSADWMGRNLDRRIELLVPVDDPEHRQRLAGILRTYFDDHCQSWQLDKDGGYTRLKKAGARQVRSQEVLYRDACERARRAAVQAVVFEPHRPPE